MTCKKKQYLCLLWSKMCFSLIDLFPVRMVKEGRRTQILTLDMNRTGRLSAPWRKIVSTSLWKIQVQVRLPTVLENIYVQKRCETKYLVFSCRSVGFQSASVRALLSSEGPLLLGPKLFSADQQRWAPTASPALPQRRNQGTAQGTATLHHPGPVSVTDISSSFWHVVTISM